MISPASSIKFRKQDGLLPSFDNVMFEDETHFRIAKHCFFHKLYSTDTVTVQAELVMGQTMAMYYSLGTLKSPGVVNWGEWTDVTTEALVFSSALYDYWEADLAMTGLTYVKYKALIYTAETLSETWLSEPVEIIAANSDYLQIEYFNLENAFHVYYVNATEADRISHLHRIKGTLRNYKPAGEDSVYDNQSETVKTKSEVKRILTLKTEAIPPYLAEMLAVALAHDKFFINEVEFIADKKPEYENTGDLSSLTCELTQRDVIGVNAHDIGYNCDGTSTTEGMTILQELAASGQKSLTVTADHMVLSITGERVTGSPVIKVGTTPGGNEILYDMSLVAVTNPIEVAIIPTDRAALVSGILYVTVSGAGATANIYVATFKNRQ